MFIDTFLYINHDLFMNQGHFANKEQCNIDIYDAFRKAEESISTEQMDENLRTMDYLYQTALESDKVYQELMQEGGLVI